MAYSPTNDFLALLRQTSGGGRLSRMPGLDYVVEALSRAGLFLIYVGQTAPVANQATTLWFQPAAQSWLYEGTVYLWNAAHAQYEIATPALWYALFFAATQTVNQDVNTAGPVNVGTNTTTLRVLNVGAPVALVLPLASTKVGDILISDWANAAGTNNITVTLSGADTFPNGLTVAKIAADGGSLRLHAVSGGYAW